MIAKSKRYCHRNLADALGQRTVTTTHYVLRLGLGAYLTLCKINRGKGKSETEKVAQKAVAGRCLEDTR